MNKKKFEDLLQAYHQGRASKEEAYIVDRWYELTGSELLETPQLSEQQQEALRNRLLGVALSKKTTTKWYRPVWWQAAAILLLVFSLFYIRFSQDKQPVEKKNAEMLFVSGERQLKKIILPDSTIVWLNAQSTLTVEAGYGLQNRRLRLEGEAFFEVSKNEKYPMCLDAGGIQVSVLGTSFNVNAYAILPEIKVALHTGKVQVNSLSIPEVHQLTPGERLVYNKAQEHFQKSKTDVSLKPDWTGGTNLLEQASFNELAQVFRNLYGAQLKTDSPRIKNHRYDLTLRSRQTVEEALKTLCTILNADYRREENGKITLY